uniref:Uncharacterized protein n=1 Tax=Ciona intestinalis TaxID=7719 RepID=H2Y0U0_CIOIN
CLLLVAVCTASKANSIQVKKWYSESSKQKLAEAAKRAIDHLCSGENIPDDINDMICSRAALNEQGVPGFVRRTCMNCHVADPVCFNSCPSR